MYWLLICLIPTIIAHRESYDSKCKRTCNTQEGSFDCWKQTTDGFSYGLSTTMIDFCQTILKIRSLGNESWYNISRDILAKQIEQYEIDGDAEEGIKQLTKENIEQIAVSLLDQCFNASSSIIPSEPVCPSCSENQTKRIYQWRLSSIIILAIGLFLVFLILLLYSCQTYYIRRSYTLLE